MKRINQLTAAFVNRAKPGRHGDGAGLYLEVANGGGKSWVFMWKRNGRRRAMGLGSAYTISLVKARELAKAAAEAIAEGRDPIEERRERRANAISFGQAASKCHADIKSGWRSSRHSDHWLSSLNIHTKKLSSKFVSEITVHDVVGVLRPLWDRQPDLALRLRERIEKVLDWAKVNGYRDEGDWAGDKTPFPRDVIEMALAHAVGDATEQAYRRGRAVEQRRELMNAWAAYCERPPAADNVISIERRPIPA
jgi:hypothetical protein